MNCPQCGKALRDTENVYKYGGPSEQYQKRKVGERPALNPYAPFCTLRCGWRWAQEHVGRKKK
jgi:endogenous inhibitor of DNA gyrase (YacG/DUF329 family)